MRIHVVELTADYLASTDADSEDRVDYEESAKKHNLVLHERLREAYPDAEIVFHFERIPGVTAAYEVEDGARNDDHFVADILARTYEDFDAWIVESQEKQDD